MAKIIVLLLSTLAVISGSSGASVSGGKQCTEPLWTVVGNHYVPRENCDISIRDVTREAFLRKKYSKLLTEGQENPRLEEVNHILERLMTLLPPYAENLQESVVDKLKCVGCSTGVDTYKILIQIGFSKEKILNLLNKICIDFHIMSPSICTGILNLYGYRMINLRPVELSYKNMNINFIVDIFKGLLCHESSGEKETLMNVVDKTPANSKQVCGLLLNINCGGEEFPGYSWNVTIPPTKKPPVTKPINPPTNATKLKVLHISDTHWDTEYQEGSWAECNLPLCCRKENVLPDDKATKAGKYGGWRCDTPEETFDSVLKHIAKQHPDLDYIIWTGDIPAHDIWAQTRAANLNVLKKTVAKFSAFFPKIPMFPALGNHESVPSNMFPTGKGTGENPMDWLFNEVNTQWSRWLPQNVSETIRLGAFYTTLIRPNLRLVSMNMNYCYNMNWWLFSDNIDPVNELEWLVKVLQESENKKEKVHIIGHIPPGSTDCMKTWQTNFYNIINRFEGTVTAQFYGHTHSDEYEVFYDMKNTSRPIGVSYVGPSVTTYMYHNPAYRIYYIDGDHDKTERFVLDHETWYLDLEKANQEKRAEWKKLYNARDAYKLKNLFPEEWHNLYLRIKNSDEDLQLYHKYFWNDSPKRPNCSKNTLRNLLCGIRSCVQYGEP